MRFLVFLILALVLFPACGGDSDGPGILSLSNDRDEAIALIKEANTDLTRIRVLYRENNAKFEELKEALKSGDIEKVKKLADELSLVIHDGYTLAETAKQKLAKAQLLDINSDFKYYLRLKEDGLTKQIKAFDYRRESAKLFRDKFGTNDPAAMKEAADKFKENEANFQKLMDEATKVSEEADELYKRVNKAS